MLKINSSLVHFYAFTEFINCQYLLPIVVLYFVFAQARLAQMEKEEREEEERKRREAHEKAEYAKKKAEDALKGGDDDNTVVEDSEIVGEIFGFLDTPKKLVTRKSERERPII